MSHSGWMNGKSAIYVLIVLLSSYTRNYSSFPVEFTRIINTNLWHKLPNCIAFRWTLDCWTGCTAIHESPHPYRGSSKNPDHIKILTIIVVLNCVVYTCSLHTRNRFCSPMQFWLCLRSTVPFSMGCLNKKKKKNTCHATLIFSS